MNQDVLVVKDGYVGRIKLNRVKRHNSLTPEFLEAFKNAVIELERCEDILVIEVTSLAKSFSTGGDLGDFYSHGDNIEKYAIQIVGDLNDLMASMLECSKPIVTLVDGQVTGGSMGIVLASDIVLVSENGSFRPYYVDVGFNPDGGWATLLADVIGHQRAKTVQLLNDTITAKDAVSWGMAYRLVASTSINQEAEKIYSLLATKKSGTIRNTKKLLRYENYQERLEQERGAFCELVGTEEAMLGLKDFLEKLKK